MTISVHVTNPRAAGSSLTVWHLAVAEFAFICVLLLLGVGSDPTRYTRSSPTVATFDWVAPGLEARVPGAPAHIQVLDAPDGSLSSLASHELRKEQDRAHPDAVQVAGAAPHGICDSDWRAQSLAIGDRHGQFDARYVSALAMSHGRDNRARPVVAIRGLPAPVIPADEPDLCDVPAASWRLAGFVAPPRLNGLLGYFDPGYFAPV